MYFISKGKVEVCSADGKTIFKVLQEGEFFGEIALLLEQPRSAYVKANGHVDLFVLYRDDFQMLLEKYPQFAEKIKETTIIQYNKLQ
jgi:CRP-like cAMP-binding protein